MTERSPARAAHDTDQPKRCGACGQPTDELVDGCCALCGQRLEERDVTAEDHTPYARATETGGGAWPLMCAWVYGAGRQRLAHLGLTRPSRASQRFVRINLILFAAAVALAVFANTGWHVVTPSPGLHATTLSPTGRGWWHCLQRVTSADQSPVARALPTDLWWNIPWAMLSAVAALLTTVPAGLILLWLVSGGSRRALRGEHSAASRLQCAVHYSTAWIHFVALGAVVLVFRPLVMICRVAGWDAVPSKAVIDVPAVLLGLVGVLLWWFWLIRLSGTVPRETRGSVGRFFMLWTPLLVIAVAAGTSFGLHVGLRRLAEALNLSW